MNKRSIVFYFHPAPIDQPDPGIYACVPAVNKNGNGYGVSVRAELVRGGVEHALASARPKKGETVLSAVPFSD